MTERVFAAIDLGASSGRVIAGVVTGGHVELVTVHRFANGAVEQDGHLRWPLGRLWAEVLTGLRLLAERYPAVESIGIDTWAVDYGLLDEDGALLADPVSHRDPRTDDAVARVHSRVSAAELFAINGLQFLPFNTVYQFAAEAGSPLWSRAAKAVLIPDLLAYWLTGELAAETTNASTTGLLDATTGQWSAELTARLGISTELLPRLDRPGDHRGTITAEVAERTGLPPGTEVTTVGSHDTASAVVAVPAATPRFAYVSSGTWSLVGLELDSAQLTEAARSARFTNEAGVDGRIRFLRNVGGLWLLQESMRTWAEQGRELTLEELLAEAAALPPGAARIDVDDEAFIPPGAMPERIRRAAGLPDDVAPAVIVRCVLDSLADAYARTIRTAVELTGAEVDVVHIVGGGSQNELLCRLTATATGLPVVAGPVEATALGNVLVQARAHGAVTGALEDLRGALAVSQPTRRYETRAAAAPVE